MEKVILVDEYDNEIGIEEKIKTHQAGLLHRAFSVFIVNKNGDLLLQQRSLNKYHSAGLWTNTCCSHPRPNENVTNAAERRLQEEMGFTTKLKPIFQFIYNVAFENGLSEHEYDHVLLGEYNGEIRINEQEVADFKFVALDAIEDLIATTPEQFTTWFRIAFPRLKQWLQANSH